MSGAIKIIVGVFLFVLMIVGINSCGVIHKEQDELAFEYVATSGMPVSPENNPLIGYGFHFYTGWNTFVFRTTSQSHQYAFTAEPTKTSPFDEAATFDSYEGVTMKVNFTIMGHVGNIWRFYDNYGRTQYKLPSEFGEIKDGRIYEAIREAGHYALAAYCEIAEDKSATEIKQSPNEINKLVTAQVKEYMEPMGFVIDEVFISGAINFPGGDAINISYTTIGQANTEFEEAGKEKERAAELKKSAAERGKREADKILSEANREASRLSSEAQAIAADLKESISQIGVDNAVDQYISRELAKLVQEGVIPEAVLTQDSILGAPFYNRKIGTQK
jgi:regulator of protease activity HflC (stomatin/prohibitin superfamily)